jgi:glycosyltransferase involved in cell wall biosynthesis
MPDPIRVMRIITRLNIGGPAQHVVLLTAALNDADFQSTLVTGLVGAEEGDMTDYARAHGVEPVVIPWIGREISPKDDLRALLALRRLMARERPDVVHTHTAKAGWLGRLAAYTSGVPAIVHTFHGHVFWGYFGPAKTRFFIHLERLAARLSSVILTISERLRQDLIRFRIAPPDRIRVVPLGLELAHLSETHPLRGEWRRELGISTDSPLIGIIGRLVPIKNHALFLEAARLVREHLPEAHFVIVGDGECRDALQALTDQLGLAQSVTFTGWRRDLPAVYADLDVLVVSSRNEGTPVSVIEAMAAGVPVVATRVGGIPDLLQDGALGALTPSEDGSALANAVLAMLRQRDAHRLTKARDWVLAHYSIDRLANDTRTLYQALLQGKQP